MHRRRFFQVSIRTLLILTTIVATGLGYWTHIQERVRQQKIAVARVLELGGKTTARKTTPVWPSLQRLIGDDYFQEIAVIDLNESLVTDKDLEVIGKLRGLKSLSIVGAMPRRCGFMPPLANNPRHLPSQITSEGIRRLGLQQTLESVTLANTPITDEALETIATWPQLELLDLRNTKVTSRGVPYLQKLGGLQELDLSSTGIDDDAVPVLCQMGSLKKLDIEQTAVTGEGLWRLREALPDCELRGNMLDASTTIDPDPESTHWKKDIRAIWLVSRMDYCRLIVLAESAVTDLHLRDMHELENVEVIDLRRTKVTEDGIATLQRALPKCKIVR